MCLWHYSLKLAAFYGTRARKSSLLTPVLWHVYGWSPLPYTVSCMYSNIIRSLAPSFLQVVSSLQYFQQICIMCLSHWRFTCLAHFVLLDLRQ